jgi:copper transporter 1
MLLNWHTIDACFLSSAFHIRSSFTFFLTCLTAFLLVISLEFIRRSQRKFDEYLCSRKAYRQGSEYALTGGAEEKLLDKNDAQDGRSRVPKEKLLVVALEQLLRGAVHTIQFAVSYIVM